ncbi:MAG: ABC transporter substrate-binding protein [Sporichthyaceae bacterium]
MPRASKSASLLLAGALALTACGGGDDGPAAVATDGVQTGPGVTADTITLGVMTDLTGPFKELATTLQIGHGMWADEVNAAGGICKRQVKVETLDHGYKTENAMVQFPDLEPRVAGFMELLGSAVISALKTDINDKQVTTLAVSWSSELLDQPYVVVVGTTYDLEIINGLDWLLEKGEIAKGDTIGHIYIEGEYGANGLAGSQYFAKQNGLKVVAEKVTSTDVDVQSIVTKFKGRQVKAIALSTTPPQTASAAANNVGLKLEARLLQAGLAVLAHRLHRAGGQGDARRAEAGSGAQAVPGRQDVQGAEGVSLNPSRMRAVISVVPGKAEGRTATE